MEGLAARRVDHRRHRGCSRRNRQSHEVFAIRTPGILRHRVLLDIEAGQARGPAQHKQERDEVAGAVQIFEDPRVNRRIDELHAPGKRQHRGRDAEADGIRKRIHLLAEFAYGVGEARDAPVQTIQEYRPSDRHRGVLKMMRRRGRVAHHRHRTLERFDQRIKAQEHVAGGEHRGQRIGRAPRPAIRRSRIDQAIAPALIVHAAPLKRARMPEPPATLWPAFTSTSHSGPRNTSMREPNFMRPMRCPVSTVFPACT